MGDDFFTEDEKRLWHEVNKDTKPLKKEKRVTQKPPKTPQSPKKSLVSFPLEENPIPKDKVDKTRNTSTSLDSLDRKTSRKIRKQSLTVDARLDLHGFYQTQAYEKLRRFIPEAQARGYKLVLIITGKGRPGSPSVLNQNVPRWLKDSAAFPQVLSISKAQPQDGGNGAFYVFLRKR